MELFIELLKQYPKTLAILSALVYSVSWLCNNQATKWISAFPMPTKNSSPRYIWWFQFLNNRVGNDKRAELPKLEASPNFHDAVNIVLTEAGRAPLTAPAKTTDWQQDSTEEKK